MLDAREVEIIVLELGSEDRYGLHEVLWALNSRYPDVSDNEKFSAARQAVSSLLGRGKAHIVSSTVGRDGLDVAAGRGSSHPCPRGSG